jgi:rhodanese-related sulfurtransferase
MGLFTCSLDINKGVEEFRATPGALLVDVRTPDEYRAGHISGSINIPLAALPARCNELGALDTPLFVHCLSGGRSGQAVSFLKSAGYTNVKNIGGINAWRGKVEY